MDAEKQTYDKRSSLASKLLRIILGVYFIVAMSSTATQLFLEFNNEKDRLSNEVQHVIETFSPIFAQAFWNLDDEQVASNLRGVGEFPSTTAENWVVLCLICSYPESQRSPQMSDFRVILFQ